MKTNHFAYVASLLCLATACQPQQEQILTQTPQPVASSIWKENNETPIVQTPQAGGSGRVAAATTVQQQEILTYLNQARSKSCLCGSTTYPATTPLQLNTKLNAASDKHAVDMATYNYFSHTGRDGSRPWDRMTREGYVWRTAGENIAAGYTTTRAVVDGWLRSPGHCANIMNPNFKEVGVGYGYSTTSTYKHYWVTDFGTQL
ncbi:CAP domain-containing protein [Rudanella paleaurantiibacter]|uniref:CAP domain-containing protein n=1 Tax=Rudanella paleaurantiibacter TaxID=2614655 RepID=A0A7J5U651_9BACT|nr:CAP domain-containing protein [Rudanella paleaurantiibacter]KAB7733057.1 CAP domain-containing protein [Rudanella paleaurantiibacter]